MDVECGLSEPFVECGRGEGSFSGRKCSSTFYARRLRAPCSPIGVAVFEEALRSLLSKDGPDADKRGNLPAGICPPAFALFHRYRGGTPSRESPRLG
jgi:hypothetical protein